MDLFNPFLALVTITGQGVLHAVFTARLTGRRPGARYAALYLALLFAIEFFSALLSLEGAVAAGLELLALYAVNRRVLHNRPAVSWSASILAFCISQLSFGILNSIEALVFPQMIGSDWLYPLLLLAAAASLALYAVCCHLALQCASLCEDIRRQELWFLPLPVLFFSAVELYVLQNFYHSAFLTAAPKIHLPLLALQVTGLGALFCTLYAYRKICNGLFAQAALDSLAQAAQAQKTYVAEARLRCEKTRAFRHDIQNHLTVLNGLLDTGQVHAAKTYLEKLDAAAAVLSAPCRTGNPVVDILLGEKLALAASHGIDTDVSLLLPASFPVDDIDLCVIFANALDNAIHACAAAGGTIRIRGERQGGFYLLSFENTCPAGPQAPAGTGISNMRTVAEKYHGAVETAKDGPTFSLDILLNVSIPPKREPNAVFPSGEN